MQFDWPRVSYGWTNFQFFYVFGNKYTSFCILNKVLAPFKDKIGMHTPVSGSNNIFPLYKLNKINFANK